MRLLQVSLWIGNVLYDVPHGNDVERSIVKTRACQRAVDDLKALRLCLFSRPTGRFHPPSVPAALLSHIDENADVTTYIQQSFSIRWADDSLQGAQVPSKGQYPSLPLLNI